MLLDQHVASRASLQVVYPSPSEKPRVSLSCGASATPEFFDSYSIGDQVLIARCAADVLF
jgi:hypothetical protein